MKLSRNQKRCAYVLGACAVALLVDRMFLAPAEAEAVEPGSQASTAAQSPSIERNPAPSPVSIARKPLADRLAALAGEYAIDLEDLSHLSNPFEVPWFEAVVVVGHALTLTDGCRPVGRGWSMTAGLRGLV